MTVKVAIADDQAMVRAGLALILGSEEGIEVVAEATDGEEAVAVARDTSPDVILMDVQMPRLDGIAATRAIVEEGLAARVLILTTFERDDYIFEALRSGASGFLLKNSPPEELIRAVRALAAGDALLAPAVTRRVIAGYARAAGRSRDDGRLESLTERETEVLRLLAAGRTNAEVALALDVGEGTVKTHVSHVLNKLELRDRVQAVVFAYESGLVVPGAEELDVL